MSTIAPVERRFGVEIECGHSGGTVSVRNSLHAAKIPHLDVGSDGSGVEVRTRPLKGKQGFRDLDKLFGHLNKIGCFVSQADGQHIHIEARDYAKDAELRARLIESYAANRDHIVKFVDPRRRGNYGSCANTWVGVGKKAHKGLLDRVKEGTTSGFGRGDVNLSNLHSSKRTIEIRLHEGNLEFEKIQAWIHFWINFLDEVAASEKPLRSYKYPYTLFRGIKVDPVMRSKLKDAAKRYDRDGSTLSTYSAAINSH